jgi:hypothetical protein
MERAEEVRRPLSTNGATIVEFQRVFLRAFPFKRFHFEEKNVDGDEAVRYAEKLLLGKKVQQLIALLCHLMYWSIFGEYTKRTLDPPKKEQIVMSLQRLHLDLDTTLRKRRFYSIFFLPLFLDSVCSTCQNIFRQSFPKWFSSR